MNRKKQFTLAMICFGFAMVSSALGDRTPAVPSVSFMEHTYRLVSFNQKTQPTWEFTSNHETAADWTTKFTIIDRSDLHTSADLESISAGMKSDAESRGGKVLVSTSMRDDNGKMFPYTVIGFDQPAQHRFELDFVKAAIGSKNAYVAVYCVRITDEKDYVNKTKMYLHTHSSAVGTALSAATLPDIAKLPRTEF